MAAVAVREKSCSPAVLQLCTCTTESLSRVVVFLLPSTTFVGEERSVENSTAMTYLSNSGTSSTADSFQFRNQGFPFLSPLNIDDGKDTPVLYITYV